MLNEYGLFSHETPETYLPDIFKVNMNWLMWAFISRW